MAHQQPNVALMHWDQLDSDSINDLFRNFQFVYRGPFIYTEICEYFQQFGRIESMQTNFKNDVHYGYVRVEMTAMDAVILSKVSHRIADCVVNIGDPNDLDLDDPDDCMLTALDPLSVPTDQDATNHILILNDDCLRNVLKRLNLTDLIAASDVCIRFNQVAKDVFGTKYSNSTYYIRQRRRSNIETYLRNFGAQIESLKIGYYLVRNGTLDRTTDVICMIEKHCRNVKKLAISEVNFSKEFRRLHPIFSKLEHFRMVEDEYDCVEKIQEMDETMTYLLSVCDNLKTLRLGSDRFIRKSFVIRNPLKCIMQKFPSLQKASIIRYSGVEDDTLEQFFALNSTLNKLEIYCTNEGTRSTKVFRWIGQYLVHLTKLKFEENLRTTGIIEHHQNDIQCLSSLTKLIVLELDFCWLSVTPLMESLATNGIPIEQLKLSHGSFDNESIKNISKLKQIKILEISDPIEMNDDFLIELAKELPQLSELRLLGNIFDVSTTGITKAISHANRLSLLRLDHVNEIKIGMDDYNAMLESVLNRAERVKLKISILNEAVRVSVFRAILYQNRDWLDIIWGRSARVDTEESDVDSVDSDGSEM